MEMVPNAMQGNSGNDMLKVRAEVDRMPGEVVLDISDKDYWAAENLDTTGKEIIAGKEGCVEVPNQKVGSNDSSNLTERSNGSDMQEDATT